MKGVRIIHRGSFNNTEKFLNAIKGQQYLNRLAEYGEKGVEALTEATPKDTGLTASSWVFDIVKTKSGTQLSWSNTNENDGFNVARALQYGHGTGSGGYVRGQDYINPAIRPVVDEISEGVWKEIESS